MTHRTHRERAIDSAHKLYLVGESARQVIDDCQAAAVELWNVRYWLERAGYSRGAASARALRLCRMHFIGDFHERERNELAYLRHIVEGAPVAEGVHVAGL